MRVIIALICTFVVTGLDAQVGTVCDTICSEPDTAPQYAGASRGIMDYVINELVPVIEDCNRFDSDPISKLIIVLTIDRSGKVIDAVFPKPQLGKDCTEKLRSKLLTMKGWTAGQRRGIPVCSNVTVPISCLKWD